MPPLYEGSSLIDVGRARSLRSTRDAIDEEQRQAEAAARAAAEDAAAPTVTFAPQEGFQENFAASEADITIGGGSANCGKTYVCIMEGARDAIDVPGMATVFFRRSFPQIMAPGGLWAEATKLYPKLGARRNLNDKEWRWPEGGLVKFAHLEYDHTVHGWQGSQIPLIIFDELTHFSAYQFWYMYSRNRSNVRDSEGRRIRARMLATCNPDADSWVAELIAWWIEQDPQSPNYGFPIRERGGVLRWMTRINDAILWGDSREEVQQLARDAGEEIELEDIRSLTFVPGKLEDNKKGDPRYRGNLKSMDRVSRARLLDGNWKVRASSGDVFRESEAVMLDEIPSDVEEWVRRWDLAATEPSEENKNPDWTCGVLMGRRPKGRYVVADVKLMRRRADDVRKLIVETAKADKERYGPGVKVCIPQEPGQAGKDQIASFVKLLAGFGVKKDVETGDKEVRANPLASQWQAGNVDVVRGAWNAEYFLQMEGFPGKGIHDDAVDASSGAFARLARASSMWNPAIYGLTNT